MCKWMTKKKSKSTQKNRLGLFGSKSQWKCYLFILGMHILNIFSSFKFIYLYILRKTVENKSKKLDSSWSQCLKFKKLGSCSKSSTTGVEIILDKISVLIFSPTQTERRLKENQMK